MTELNYICDKKIRCDVFLSEKISNLSRTSIQKLIKEKFVFVNGKNIKPNIILDIGDEISVSIPEKKEIKSELIYSKKVLAYKKKKKIN